jgi:hypothetical protein
MVDNHMSYGQNACASTFTDDQVNRIHARITNTSSKLHSLVDSTAHAVAGIQGCAGLAFTMHASIVSYITNQSSIVYGAAGCVDSTSFNFETNNYAGATYNWQFGPHGVPSTSTVFNPLGISFDTAGVHQITLTITAGGTSTSSTYTIVIGDCKPNSEAWHFGNKTRMTFSSGLAQIYSDSTSINTSRTSAASYTAPQGTIYSNGADVWVTNGTTTLAVGSLATGGFGFDYGGQNVVIVPRPGSANQFFIYCIKGGNTLTQDGLMQYTLIYNGSTVTLSGPTLPAENYRMQDPLHVIKAENGVDYWLLCKPYEHLTVPTSTLTNVADHILAYKITSSGINIPVVSYAGSGCSTIKVTTTNGYQGNGYFASSPNKKLVTFSEDKYLHRQYYFNSATGVLNYRAQFNSIFGAGSNAGAYSTNNHLLYLNDVNDGIVRQFQISDFFDWFPPIVPSYNDVIAQPVGNGNANPLPKLKGIRLAPDGRIYFASNRSKAGSIGAIFFPDVIANNNNQRNIVGAVNDILLPDSTAAIQQSVKSDFPNIIHGDNSLTTNDFNIYPGPCGWVQILNFTPTDSFNWTFGDNTAIVAGRNNGASVAVGYTQNNEHPKHQYAVNGTYTITCVAVINGVTTVVSKTITITNAKPKLSITQTLCTQGTGANTAYTLLVNTSNYTPAVNLSWQNSSTSGTTTFVPQPAMSTATTSVYSIDVNPLGIYTFTATTDSLCFIKDTINVIQPSITASYTTTCANDSLGIILISGLAGYSYSITTPSGSTYPVPAGTSVTGLGGGSYTVTGIDSSLLACNLSTVFNVLLDSVVCNCVPNTASEFTLISNGNNDSLIAKLGLAAGTSTIANKKLVLKGTFTLTDNLTFEGCDIRMASDLDASGNNNTKIDCSHYNLTLTDHVPSTGPTVHTSILACEKMWQGIISTGAASNKITIKNSTLKDMIQGVHMSNFGAVLDVSGSTFENNLIGIQLNSPTANIGGQITGNTFSTGGGLLAPHNITGKVGQHGIKLLDVVHPLTIGGFSSSLGNTFQNLENGIYLGKTNAGPLDMFGNSTVPVGFISQNNQFIDIVGGAEIHHYSTAGNYLYGDSKGCGIYVYNYHQGIKNPLVKPIASYYESRNDNFENVTKGIVANVGNGTVNQANMSQVQCGIMNNFTDYCRYSITQNTIADAHLGIQFVGNSGNRSVVQNNQIDLSANYLVMNYPKYIFDYGTGMPVLGSYVQQAIWPIGIDVQNHSNSAANTNLLIGADLPDPTTAVLQDNGDNFSNIITVPSKGGIGIRLNNTSKVHIVSRNLVKYSNGDVSNCGSINNPTNLISGSCGDFVGISVTNAVKSTFAENKVKGLNTFAGAAFNNRFTKGFMLDNSSKLEMICNTTSDVQYGIYAQGNCNTAATAIAGNTTNNNKIGWYFRSYSGIPGGFGSDIGSTSADNNNLWLGAYYSLGNAFFSNGPCKVYRSTFASDNLPYNIWNQNGTITTAESKANFAGKHYQPLFASNTLPNDCSSPSTLKLTEEDVPIQDGQLAMAITPTGVSYPLFDQIADYIDDANAYRALDVDSFLRLSNASYNTFYTTNWVSNLGRIRQSDRALAALLDSVAMADSTIYANRLADIETSTNAIANNGKFFENCERSTNELYLQIMKHGLQTIDSAAGVQLSWLAQQCPAGTGTCVYKARSIMAMLVPGVQYYDDIACAAILPLNKNGTNPYGEEQNVLDNMQAASTEAQILQNIKPNEFIVYPNPASVNTQLNIVYDIGDRKSDCVNCFRVDICLRR